MKFARVPTVPGAVVELFATQPVFHPDVMATIYSVPDTTQLGWIYNGTQFSAPPVVGPTLLEAQNSKIRDVEIIFLRKSAEGFLFETNWYSLTTYGKQRVERVRLKGNSTVLTTSGIRVNLATTKTDAWLAAGDAAQAALYNVADGHVANIKALSTVAAVQSYDHTTGWPAGNPGTPGWPPPALI